MIVTTWTHSSYSDVWPMYYGQYKECAPFFDHAIMINEPSKMIPEYCRVILNNENDPLYKRLIESLEQIADDIILFSLEDFILFGKVSQEHIEKSVEFLQQSNYDFIRLLKSGIHGPIKTVNKELCLNEVPPECQYLYSLNASIWKRQSLIDHYASYRPLHFMEAEAHGSNAARSGRGLKGLFFWDDDPIAAGTYVTHHCDSRVFPHMSSALKGWCNNKPSRWNTSLYSKRLNPLFEKYLIDPKIRGTV